MGEISLNQNRGNVRTNERLTASIYYRIWPVVRRCNSIIIRQITREEGPGWRQDGL